MGNRLDWAKREVELALKDCVEEDDVYVKDCITSALEIYEVLCNQGHSGLSVYVTKSVLDRLIDGRPLTPIEFNPEDWLETYYNPKTMVRTHQCSRMSSLFMDVDINGNRTLHDVQQFSCVHPNGSTSHFNFVDNLLRDMYPIKFPYMPEGTYKVFVEDFLYDSKNGDFDTYAIYKVLEPNGEVKEINRYFKEDGSGWKEIDKAEFDIRIKNLKEEKC